MTPNTPSTSSWPYTITDAELARLAPGSTGKRLWRAFLALGEAVAAREGGERRVRGVDRHSLPSELPESPEATRR